MPLIKSQRSPLNKAWLKIRQREIDANLCHAFALMDKWPKAWEIDERDRRYGEDLLKELKPFVRYLAETKQLARSTLRRHLNQLFLLGGEIISTVNTHERDRHQPAARLLDKQLAPDGGPYCRHIDTDQHQRQFDSTCRQLFAFRSTLNCDH